uniref:vacuolar protein sorting-associated protein 26B-A-like isoform X2 n=1 Tax=Myxine glutinosa TaxID=7769 RepID=UPI00358FA2A8
MEFLGLGPGADVDIQLMDSDGRSRPLCPDGETLAGRVRVRPRRQGQSLQHNGLKVEFVGHIEIFYERINTHEFVSLVKELAPPGKISQPTSFDFEFNHVEKPYESYRGQNINLRYFLRATLRRRLSDVVQELELQVLRPSSQPELDKPIRMEVGIEDCLHIEFEYDKSKYHLKDVIVGKIYFQLVRIKVRYMELDIIRRETMGSGPNAFDDHDILAKYEIMDGAPVRGESIPIRLFLGGYPLAPTMCDVNRKFSVRYFLNLVLIDEEERRYFKQQEITLWRKGDIVRRSVSHVAAPRFGAPPLSTAPASMTNVTDSSTPRSACATATPASIPTMTGSSTETTSSETDWPNNIATATDPNHAPDDTRKPIEEREREIS